MKISVGCPEATKPSRVALPDSKSNVRFHCITGMITGLVLALSAAWTPAQNPPLSGPNLPDYFLYHRAFHRVVVLMQMADAAQQSGRDRSNLRQLVRLRAGLSEAEGAILETVALQCESDVAAQDAKAKAIIDQFHAQSSRLVNPSFPPQAPPQLDALWQDRNNIVLRARDSLRSQLGEESFSIFDQFVREATSASVTNPGTAKP